MNGIELLVLLIAAIGITAVVVLVYVQDVHSYQLSSNPIPKESDVRVVNVIAQNISNGSFKQVRISVTTTGKLALNTTLITLQTANGSADLQWRNGTLKRNVTTGFYTQ